ncbi:MAG TPA: hypothetical protein ENN79_03275 [Desulfobacteraceae bacterium]|jgi:hypothetical protein|nr:hypothetical protein [Desulfobacteraceae bacterium]
MVSVLIVIGCLVAAFFVVVTVQSSPKNPAGFARMIARQQRLALNTIKKADPGLSREQAYLKAMNTRTPHEEDELLRMLNQVKKEAGRSGEPFRFNDLVYHLSVLEYTKRVPLEKRRTELYPEMEKAVKAAIPDDT